MTTLIELPIGPNAGALQPVYFQNQPQLQSVTGDQTVFILGLEAVSNLILTDSPLTPGNPVAAIGDLQNATLTLNVAGTLKYLMIPLILMHRAFSYGINSAWVNDVFRLKNTYKVDWTKSYIQLINAPVTEPPYSYLLNVYYQYDEDSE